MNSLTVIPDQILDHSNIYTACLVVNHAANEKRYMYDVADIKKEACNPLKTDRTSDI